MSGGIDFDISAFVNDMNDLAGDFLKAAERGAGKAASALLNDSIKEINRAPLDEGTLRGSGSVFVQNALTEIAPNVGGAPTPATVDDEPLPPDAIVAVVGFNTPYAAYQHEGQREDGSHVVQNYSHSGTGKKFLERKLFENRDDYIAIAAAEVKKVIGSA